MYSKITILITLLFTAILLYLANKYNQVAYFKFAEPKDFVPYYEAAASNFLLAGYIIFFISWVWVDVVAIKTKQLFWLCIPFLFTVLVAIISCNQSETLFNFKRMNGMWKGGFSISYFIGAAAIFIVGVFIMINYIAFKKYFNKTTTS